MIKVISRAPNDNFTFRIFRELIDSLDCKYEAYYIWSNPPEILTEFLTNTKFSKPNIIIGIKDLLDLWQDHNFWKDTTQAGIAVLDSVASKYPDKNFIIFTSLENINLESIQSTNIQYVPWGGDIVNQAESYQDIVPATDKNFNSTKTFISLNRHSRSHRMVTLSYLFGQEYDQRGYITYLGQEQPDVTHFDNLLDGIPWKFEERHTSSRDIMITGYKKFYNNKSLLVDNYKIYNQANDNVTNFNQSLRSKYQNSFVEIVTESSFSASGYMLTEKTLNSIYGCNFPIILSGVGAVQHLRELGFDMFDNVVDHNYDTISNPIDRIISAIEDNKKLLVDSLYVKEQWKNNEHKFQNNIKIANKTMYEWYDRRTRNQFNQLVWNN